MTTPSNSGSPVLCPTTPSDVTTATFVCHRCGDSHSIAASDKHMPGRSYYGECEKCATMRRVAQFHKFCPPLYLETDADLLPRSQLVEVMAWEFNPKGLLLTGQTGTGKTRCAWQLLRRVMTKDKPERQVIGYDSVGFGHAVQMAHNGDALADWLEAIHSADLIFFDDLGKLKMTERAEVEMFGLLDYRFSHKLPVMITTNDNGETLAARITEHRGPAIIRRLREFCQVVRF